MAIDPAARLWQLGVNRGEVISVERSYATQIHTFKGKEMRRALRDRPRKTLRFSIKGGRSCFAEYEAEVRANQGALYALPDWTRYTGATSTMPPATDNIDVAEVGEWAAIGTSVILADSRRVEIRTIGNVVASTLFFVEVNGATEWPIGTRVYAGLQGHWPARLAGSRPIDEHIAIGAQFDVEPTTEPYIEPPAAPVTFNGREVFNTGRARVEPVTADFLSGLKVVDGGISKPAYFNDYDFPAGLSEVSFAGCDAATTKLIEDVFTRQRGRQGEFYMPTWQNDLVPTSLALSGSSELEVAGEYIAAAYDGSTVFTAVCCRFADNTFEYNLVDSIAAGSGVSTLTMQNTWSRDINGLRGISWMPVHRFAQDELTTEWRIKNQGHIRIAVQTLEDLAGT